MDGAGQGQNLRDALERNKEAYAGGDGDAPPPRRRGVFNKTVRPATAPALAAAVDDTVSPLELDRAARYALLELDRAGEAPSFPPAPPIDYDKDEKAALRARVAALSALQTRGSAVPSVMPVRLTEHGYDCGGHTNVNIDPELPIVRCRACGIDLDPIVVLREYSTHERNFCFTDDVKRKEQAQLAADVERLKRERSSLRSQIAAMKKQGKLF